MTFKTHYLVKDTKEMITAIIVYVTTNTLCTKLTIKQECPNITCKNVFSWAECVSIWNKLTIVSLNLGHKALTNWRNGLSVLKMCPLAAVP